MKMRPDDIAIGEHAVSGQRITLQDPLEIILDANDPFEFVVISFSDQAGREMLTAGENGAYLLEREVTWARIAFQTEMLDPSLRYLVFAYATEGNLPKVLATISAPRKHTICDVNGSGACLLEIYAHNDDWKCKIDGDPYQNGLASILSAFPKISR